MPTTDPLPYESRTPGALQVGETVLWEGESLPGRCPPSVRAVFITSSLVLIVLLTSGTLLGMAGLMPPALFLILLAATGGAMTLWVCVIAGVPPLSFGSRIAGSFARLSEARQRKWTCRA